MNRMQTYNSKSVRLAEYLLTGIVWLLMACSDPKESEIPDTPKEPTTDTLQLMPLSQLYRDQMSTRAGAYRDYVEYTAAPISVFMADVDKSNEPPQPGLFRYNTSTHKWSSTITITERVNYSIYGFTPSNAVGASSISAPQGGFYAGAILQLKGVEGVSDKDLCIIVGAEGVATEESGVPADFRPGKFEYTGQIKGQNFAYLLLHHLYAQLSIRMKVDQEYDKLRTVKVKQMQITSGTATYQLNITLTRNNDGADPMTGFAWTEETAEGGVKTPAAPFFTDEEGRELNATEFQELSSIMVPAFNSLTLKCTYDIYKKGSTTLLRKNQTATNTLTLQNQDRSNQLVRGQKTILNLTVKPTYLYVLSDEDVTFSAEVN